MKAIVDKETLRIPVRGSNRKYYLVPPKPADNRPEFYIRLRVPKDIRRKHPEYPKDIFRSTGTNILKAAQLRARGDIEAILQERFKDQTVELRRVEVVGAQASADLRRQALFALFYATLFTVAYISWRFEGKLLVSLSMAVILVAVTNGITQLLPGVSPAILIVVALVLSTALNLILQLRFALAAIVAIYHDLLITVSFLSLFNVEFDLQILAALLTVTGYSLYDTIVVFDRIRENMRGGRRRDNFPVIVNNSINETLSRTVLTSGHTVLVLLALYLLGGEVLHGFAFALLVGMLSGTYSTVFIASPILVYWHTLAARMQAGTLPMSGARANRAS
jgi:preprotein translocase subunit SecF